MVELSWCVAYTAPSAEPLAQTSLHTAGLPVYLPTTPKGAPLFPRYLFVALDLQGAWGVACRARGVGRLLGYPGPPTPVDTALVEALKAQYPASGTAFATRAPALVPLNIGATVCVASGPYGGFVGQVLRCPTPAGRVALLLKVWGGTQRALVQVADIAG